uniref:Phosphatidic acid phosphatase type 2/haloperoxidase domain-containing protein n=1 Tax=Noctiluca scintillans TaxID=2966 RepID=A0A7S1A7N7_NOCSC|mmetsp:Transcript_34811/g.92962  ORF Transcript_34811/g.92962 Transcript_34811/m.92962 type:complete len:202 (+) Transcript_34811:79-684(+)
MASDSDYLLAQSTANTYDPELGDCGSGPAKLAVLQVSVAWPFDWSFINLAALFFSFLPFLFPLVVLGVVLCVLQDWFVGVHCLVLIVISGVVSEFVMKPFCQQPRPPESANRHSDGTPTHGMPSGHVLCCTTLAVWLSLEAIRGLPIFEVAMVMTVTTLLLFFVAWSRWHLRDHYAGQIAVSLCVGTLIGAIVFGIDCLCF